MSILIVSPRPSLRRSDLPSLLPLLLLANDISKGTYNLQGVRNALAGALKILLNEMARRAIEKQDSLKHRRFRGSKVDEDEEARREILDQNKVINTTGKDPKSLLGTVMGVTREVINQRKNVSTCFTSFFLIPIQKAHFANSFPF